MDARKRATYQDLLAVPDHLVAEIIDGTLYTSPRPARPHARASSKLMFRIGPPWDLGEGGPGGWDLFNEPELHLGSDVVVPDIAGWRRGRLTPEETVYFTTVPDWACEILSPSTENRDRIQKLHLYGERGVQWVWLVHPIHRYIEVFERTDAGMVVRQAVEHGGSVALMPFDAVPFELSDLWEDEPPTSPG